MTININTSIYAILTLRAQEQAQLAAIRDELSKNKEDSTSTTKVNHDFEGGFGGQEDLEDRMLLPVGSINVSITT